jgi:hypothetical protein
MTREELAAYLSQVRDAHKQPFFIPRQMITREDWDRASGQEYIRLRGYFRKAKSDLAVVLDHPRVVFVGEPGMGKTVLAHAAVLHFAETGNLPIFIPLSGYAGNLGDLLVSVSGSVVAVKTVDGQAMKKALVFDGLDEVAPELFSAFLHQLEDLLAREPAASCVLTCRQAIYERLRGQVPASFLEFFPLGFDTDDILDYAGKRCLDRDQFHAELDRADLWLEASVPFVLQTLVDVVAQEHSLEPTRSDNLALVVDGLLEKRTRVGVARQRKALQLLGLAMELYSRNEVTVDEAVRLLSRHLAIGRNETQNLIDELTHSVLLRTASAIRFQLRSFGEYFAARQIENESPAQVLSYARFRKTLLLNPTWANTISHLIEINPRVRAYFVRNEPEWILPCSIAALSVPQRQEAAHAIFEDLAQTGRFLLRDLTVNHYRLARLLVPTDANWLRLQAATSEVVRRANAIVLLGHLKDVDALGQAVEIATDRHSDMALRRAAFVAVGLSGTSDLIPRLLESLVEEDPLFEMGLDAVGSLMTPETLPSVLPALMRTSMILSAANVRVSELGTQEMLAAALDYLLANPNSVCERRVASYLEPVWGLLRRHNDEEILAKIGLLFANCERYEIWVEQVEVSEDLLTALDGWDPVGVVCRTALKTILKDGLSFRYSVSAVARLCTADAARWLLEQDPPQELIRHVASRASGVVREILRPATGGLIDAQDEAYDRLRHAEAERQSRETTDRLTRCQTIRTENDADRVLASFSALTPAEWPELDDARKTWLSAAVSSKLVEADALHKIEWLGEMQVRFPGILALASEIVGHYGLPLDNDIILVHSLLALEPSFLREYHRKRPLSREGVAEIERMLADPVLPPGAVSHFLGFLQATKLESPSIYKSMRRIAVSPAQNVMNRIWAATVLVQSSCPLEELLAAKEEAENPRIQTVFLDALTERQHLPTIFERLNRVPAADQDLVALERPVPDATEIHWVGKIRSPKAWNMLAKLRQRTLRLALPNLTGVVESALAGIDKSRLVDLMEVQLQDTPGAWREYTTHRMAEYRRQLRFEQAASITFDEVLTRLAEATTDYRVRLLCEGPTDAPVLRSLLGRKGLGEVNVIPIGGWANVLSRSFDVGPYVEGFQHVLLVLDGDNGRDLSAPKHPIKPGIQRLIDTLEQVGVPVRVLDRYGIENYFTQGAIEDVLGRDLGSSFQMDKARALADQIGGYDKNRNAEVINRMSMKDFEGTDLNDILDDLRSRIEKNA